MNNINAHPQKYSYFLGINNEDKKKQTEGFCMVYKAPIREGYVL